MRYGGGMQGNPDPDQPYNELAEVASAAADGIRQAVMTAYTAGVRDGMDVGASLVQGMLDTVQEAAYAADATGLAAVLTLLRDQIRLNALQVEVPTCPK